MTTAPSRLAITDDHAALAATAARWCERRDLRGQARAALERDEASLPDGWDELTELGWMGLALPEAFDGQGYGIAELVVVLEELGRHVAPGPFAMTALAGLAIDRLGSRSTREQLLPGLATGARPAAVAIAAAPLEGRLEGDRLVVTGALAAVLDASLCPLVVAPVSVDSEIEWVALDRDAMTVQIHPSMDPTRRVATLIAESVEVPADRRLVGGDPSTVTRFAGLLLGAEAIGIAAWCVDSAALHARERVQFGRPIGQFQAVKHRAADMLATLELARAAIWDAAQAVDDAHNDAHGGTENNAPTPLDPRRRAAELAAAVGLGLAPPAATRVAQDCIQLLGGIGFTWEHDAHLYLRRAQVIKSLLPSADVARRATVELIRAGEIASRSVPLPSAAEATRPAVRAWLADLAEHPKAAWNHRIVEDGYLVPHWPTPWGRAATPAEQLVIDQEFAAAGVGRRHLQVAAWALPTLIEHGTAEQQERFVGPSMRFEVSWCQLFSEPEAGSDLAALRTRADRGDGGWLLTGQKVWTSMAHTADWGICLARTDADRPHHEGITCFFVDMKSPGIDIRPLRELTGAAWFNEVFLDDVFVPDDCVIGAVNDGWRVGRTTLANERISMGQGASIGSGISALVDLLDPDATPHQVDAVGELAIEAHALHAMRTRLVLRAVTGADAGPESSIAKLLGVIHDQRVQEVALDVLGPAVVAADGDAAGWVNAYLWNRCLTIAGGTSEIQRNVIAERLLGLPRDP